MPFIAISPEQVQSWFTPFHYFVYLGTLFIAMVVYYQWRWTKTCKTSILVLVIRADGHGDFELAPQDKGIVTLEKNKRKGTWLLNELSTVDVPYPGVGFVPQFLQKTIRMVVVTEWDWEPVTNRSPDREVVGSPAFLHNVIHEKVSELAITIAKDVLDPLKELLTRMKQPINATIFYLSVGLLLVAVVFTVYRMISVVESLEVVTDALNRIQTSLGIPIPPPPGSGG